MIFAAAVLLQAAITTPVFSPPAGTPLLVTTEQQSMIAGTERSYKLRRLIRFERAARGYRAEVRILSPSTDAPQAIGGMLEAGFAALAGRTLVFQLDTEGEVTGIDDMTALWNRLCDGIGAMVADSKSMEPEARSALTTQITAPLRALPEARRLAMLSTLVSAVIADEAFEPAGTLTPVQLPGVSPLGQKLTLNGMRTTTMIEGGEIQSVTRAAGATPASTDGRIELERRRHIDPRTGLVTFSSDTSRTVTGSEGNAREAHRTTIIRLVPAASEIWESL